MQYLTLNQVLEIHENILAQTGGSTGIRDIGGLESAIALPRMTFNGEELYPTLADKASALGYSIIQNHPFVDGNKRTGHAATEIFLLLNGYEINKSINEQEQIILQVASGTLSRTAFSEWVNSAANKRKI